MTLEHYDYHETGMILEEFYNSTEDLQSLGARIVVTETFLDMLFDDMWPCVMFFYDGHWVFIDGTRNMTEEELIAAAQHARSYATLEDFMQVQSDQFLMFDPIAA